MLKMGHRGAMGYAPENTIKSFAKALGFGVDAIELDIHAAKTGELVVIHDETFDRVSGDHRAVKDMTLQEIKQVNVFGSEKVSTLEEVLDFTNRKAKINIELKIPGLTTKLLETIKKYVENRGWSYEDFFVCSFFHPELKILKAAEPKIRISPLIMGVPENYAEFAERLHAFSVNMEFEYVNQTFVEDAHRRGIQVFVWSVNKSEDIERMKSLGVDGIISDFPDRI